MGTMEIESALSPTRSSPKPPWSAVRRPPARRSAPSSCSSARARPATRPRRSPPNCATGSARRSARSPSPRTSASATTCPRPAAADHAPPAALRGQGRGGHAGHVHAGEPGHPGSAGTGQLIGTFETAARRPAGPRSAPSNRPWRPAPRAASVAPSTDSPEAKRLASRARTRRRARRAQWQADLAQRTRAVVAQALLRERGELRGKLAGGVRRLAGGDLRVGQSDRERLGGVHRPAGEDQVQRPALADQARQAHRPAVDQRHAPSAAEDAEERRLVDDAQVAPKARAPCRRRRRPEIAAITGLRS